MKKFAWAFMTAFVSLAMVFTSCAKPGDEPSDPSKPDQPVNPEDPSKPDQPTDPEEIEFPEVSAPEEGFAKIVVKVPAGTDCNGVAFKGTNDGWATQPQTDGEKIADGWYEIELELGGEMLAGELATYYQGKVCLIPEGGTVDGSYTTQWSEGYFEINADNGQPDMFTLIEDYGKINKLAVLGSGVCYIVIDRFDANPCVANEGYSFSLALPALCDEADEPGLIGSFPASNWASDVALELDGDRWIAEDVEAQAANEFKVRLNASWDAGQVQKLNEETGEYGDLANEPFGEDLEIVKEWNEANGYAWSPCAGL
jgi:hypothetical protein